VYNTSLTTGALADDLGAFSIEARIGDTIKFRAVGFFTLTSVVTDSGRALVVMKRDTITLREVVILDKPLREALLDLQLPEKEYTIIPDFARVEPEEPLIKYPVAEPFPGVYVTVLPPAVLAVAINIDEIIATVKARTPKPRRAKRLPSWD
jgi:hypothetical protein